MAFEPFTESAARHYLVSPPSALMTELDLSLVEVRRLVQRAAAACRPPRSALTTMAALVPQRVVPTRLASLDDALLGGLRAGWLTELTATALCPSAALARQWAARATAEGHGVLWCHTDPHVDGRLFAAAGADPASLLLSRCRDLEDWCGRLALLRFTFAQRAGAGAPIALLVVDHFSTLVRRSYEGDDTDMIARQAAVATALSDLKDIARAHELAVLLLTDAPSFPEGEADDHAASNDLGKLLQHAVNMRLQLRTVGLLRSPVLSLRIVKCPLSGPRILYLQDGGDGRWGEVALAAEVLRQMGEDGPIEELCGAILPHDYTVVPAFVHM